MATTGDHGRGRPAFGSGRRDARRAGVDTSEELGRLLARARSRAFVVVDLSDCTFVYWTTLNLLLAAHRLQTKRGGRFELVLPPAASDVQQIVRLAKLDKVVTVHETRSAALAGIQSEP